jgi:acyl dehydratase
MRESSCTIQTIWKTVMVPDATTERKRRRAEARGPNARYYEDFNLRESWETPDRTISDADVIIFAGFSGNYNPLHTDEVYAKSTVFFTGRPGLSLPAASSSAWA